MHTRGSDEPVGILMEKNLNDKQDPVHGHGIMYILEEDE